MNQATDDSTVASQQGPARASKSRGAVSWKHKPHRAANACLRCRARKVRCDATPHGIPCSNCRTDEEYCEAPPRRKNAAGPKPSKLPVYQNGGAATARAPTMTPQAMLSPMYATPVPDFIDASNGSPACSSAWSDLEECIVACRLSASLLQSKLETVRQPCRLKGMPGVISSYCATIERRIGTREDVVSHRLDQLRACFVLMQKTSESLAQADEAVARMEDGIWRLCSQMQKSDHPPLTVPVLNRTTGLPAKSPGPSLSKYKPSLGTEHLDAGQSPLGNPTYRPMYPTWTASTSMPLGMLDDAAISAFVMPADLGCEDKSRAVSAQAQEALI